MNHQVANFTKWTDEKILPASRTNKIALSRKGHDGLRKTTKIILLLLPFQDLSQPHNKIPCNYCYHEFKPFLILMHNFIIHSHVAFSIQQIQ